MAAKSQVDRSYWVVVADESRAIVYARELKRSPLREVFALTNEVARMKTSELISDSGGRSFDSKGKGRHTMTREKADAKTQAAMSFSRDIAGRIAEAVHDGSCKGFALVAAPGFLGKLRKAIGVATNAEPYLTIDKAVVGKDPADIQKLLDDF